MAIAKELNQSFVDHQLQCPQGLSKIEYVDPQRTGLYIEVRAKAPGEGTYYVRYKDAARKTCHAKIARTREMTLEEARRTALEWKAKRRQDAPTGNPNNASTTVPAVPVTAAPTLAASPTPTGGITLDTFMTEHYWPHARVHKRSCWRDEQLYRRIKPKFGDLPLKGISRLAVQQFQNALLGEGLAKATVNHHVTLLRRLLNLAMSWEMVDKNVLSRIPLFHLDNQVEHYLSNEQVDVLVEVLRTDNNRMVSLILMFLLATGARLNEALCAKWKQFDRPNGVWSIPASNSKSKKIMHKPLNTPALWVLEQLRTEGESELLFPSPITGKPFTTITRQWYRIRKKAKIADNVRIHDLRHTFASRMVSAGRSLFEVQQLLGHADTRTSQRYAHLSMKAKQEASNAAAFAIA